MTVDGPLRRMRAFSTRLRFSLLGLGLFVSLSAFVAVEGRRQYVEAQISRQAGRIGAKLRFKPRSTLAYTLSFLTFHPQRQLTSHVSLTGYKLTSTKFPGQVLTREQLDDFLNLLAHSNVQSVAFDGTAFDLHAISQLGRVMTLRDVKLDRTPLTDQQRNTLHSRISQANLHFGPSNGAAFVALAHPELGWSDNSEDIHRLLEGDESAFRKMIHHDHRMDSFSKAYLSKLLNIQLGSTLHRYLLEAQLDAEMAVRWNANFFLSEIGDSYAIRVGLRDDSHQVRALVINQVARLNHEFALPWLIAMAESSSSQGRESTTSQDRVSAIRALGQFSFHYQNGRAEAALAELATQLESPLERTIALEELCEGAGHFGQQTCVAATDDSSPVVREHAVRLLARYTGPSANQAAVRLLSDVDPGVRTAAMVSIGKMLAVGKQGGKTPVANNGEQ